jgi:glycosyltransferase involved in cell wall biosynthesis
MKVRKKVLIILTPGFPENEQDSTCLPERQVFVKSLQENCPDTQLIILSFQYPFFTAQYQWNKCQVVSFNGGNKGKWKRRWVWIKVWSYLLKLHRQYEITAMISFWLGECAWLGNLFARRFHLKHYCYLLGQDARANNRFVKKVKPTADMLIALSDFLADEFFKNYLVRPKHIIPTGIDIRQYRTAEQRRDIDVIGVGSLISLKQYDVWLRVIASLVRVHKNLKAVLIGKGPERQKLIALADQLGISDRVQFEGELPHHLVLQRMQQSRVFLHTSSYEGFSTVVMEALYAGCPTVAFCAPMKKPMKNFYVVEGEDQMIAKTLELLEQANHIPVAPYKVQDSVDQVLKLLA